MGLESRDWYREKQAPKHGRAPRRVDRAILVLVCAALVAVLSPGVRGYLGYELPLGLENVFRDDGTRPGALRLEPLPGGPTLTLREPRRYAPDDPWRGWLASEATCPRGEDGAAPARIQMQVMLCLVNHARAQEGLDPLALAGTLSSSAAVKASDIARCGRFRHDACGRPADESARALGHRGLFGENLYMAEGPLVVPRVALDRWLNSEGHRKNLFRAEWRTIGIALLGPADVENVRDGVIWVNQFGA